MSRRTAPPAARAKNTSGVVASLLASAIKAHQTGKLAEGERIYRQILELEPKHPDALHLLGMAAYQRGDPARALDLIQKAISIRKNEALYHLNLGVVWQAKGDNVAAMACYRKAIQLKPDYAEAHNNLANVLVNSNQMDEATEHYEKAWQLDPRNPVAIANFGVALAEQGRTAEAIQYYRRALEMKPDSAETLCNLANALHAEQQTGDALGVYAQALKLKPDYVTAYCNLGNALQAQDAMQDAIVCYQQALQYAPGYAEAVYGIALAQLVTGQLEAGWVNYEARWNTQGHRPMRHYPQPVWRGEKIAGRLLLWGEQGVGDEVMFAGLIPDVLRTGVRCVVDCDARLKTLFARSFPQLAFVEGEAADFAAHLPLGSLPRLCRGNWPLFLQTQATYLRADKAKTEIFRRRYAGGRRRIGLAWYTKNQKSGRSRSIELTRFRDLFAVSGIRWVSLQYGGPEELAEQARAAEAPLVIDSEVDQFQDLDTFASQIDALDLVITVDNSTAHLAGALGKPVWLMLPFARDWRWFQTRKDSPWYPSMRLFRQTTAGDWSPVLREVQNALSSDGY